MISKNWRASVRRTAKTNKQFRSDFFVCLLRMLSTHEINARALVFMTSFECFDRQFSLLQTPISLKRGRWPTFFLLKSSYYEDLQYMSKWKYLVNIVQKLGRQRVPLLSVICHKGWMTLLGESTHYSSPHSSGIGFRPQPDGSTVESYWSFAVFNHR